MSEVDKVLSRHTAALDKSAASFSARRTALLAQMDRCADELARLTAEEHAEANTLHARFGEELEAAKTADFAAEEEAR